MTNAGYVAEIIQHFDSKCHFFHIEHSLRSYGSVIIKEVCHKIHLCGQSFVYHNNVIA